MISGVYLFALRRGARIKMGVTVSLEALKRSC